MISQRELRVGLSDDELNELEAFLTSRCVPHDGMNLSMLDGYLTAVVSGPEFPAPNAWLPQVWRQDETDDTPPFASMDEAKHVHSLILRRFNQISRDLQRGELNPIFLYSINSKKEPSHDAPPPLEVADMWCVGYLQGVRLRLKSWEPLRQEKGENADLLFPISAIAARWLQPKSEEQKTIADARLTDEERMGLTELIPPAACIIYRYWQARRTLPPTSIRSAPRPGRNELCPCGSTKKYKKCCG
jgi:uncharacterized protein